MKYYANLAIRAFLLIGLISQIQAQSVKQKALIIDGQNQVTQICQLFMTQAWEEFG